MESPYDPPSSLRMENGRIVEMDGKARADFDFMDAFIADHAIDLDAAEEAMAIDPLDMARMLVDIHVDKKAVGRLAGGMTPARLCEVLRHMNVVEMMMAMQKMRERSYPSNQCHVTNLRDNPVQIACDAAEAAPACSRMCAVEEATELKLGMLGLTTYAETISVYGTEKVFIDGDDTPYSKTFLAAAYASRGMKMRCTSGSGSEALMGHAEKNPCSTWRPAPADD